MLSLRDVCMQEPDSGRVPLEHLHTALEQCLRSIVMPVRLSQGTLQSGPAAPVGSQHSCHPTVKLHILPLVWIFTLGTG